MTKKFSINPDESGDDNLGPVKIGVAAIVILVGLLWLFK